MDDIEFSSKKCVPCDGNFPPLTFPQARDFMEHVPGWELAPDAKQIYRTFKFPNFKEALSFANEIGAIAEEEGHHPDLLVSWGKVGVTLSTHEIQGLAENDFIVAAKINALLES